MPFRVAGGSAAYAAILNAIVGFSHHIEITARIIIPSTYRLTSHIRNMLLIACLSLTIYRSPWDLSYKIMSLCIRPALSRAYEYRALVILVILLVEVPRTVEECLGLL